MTRNYRIILLIGFLFGSFTHLPAQSPREEIVKLNKRFAEIKDYSVDIDFETYLDNDFKKPYKVVSSNIIKKDDRYYYKRQNVEMIQNKDYSINIDHLNKMIVVQNVEKPVYKDKNPYNMVNYLDSIMKIYSDVKIESGKGVKKLVFAFKTTNYSKCEITYDPSSYLVESFIIYYRKPVTFQSAEKHTVANIIRYRKFSQTPLEKKDFFSEKNYLIIKNSVNVKPVTKYQGYQVISKIKQG